ncbi:hypothetical protein [Deinococcus maricopensis]|uniref:Lipoprotein n=1 Tax=Deinococcus maricopensis (strain DSM 21211 / LMG 22137 / NRRL B-23946 / LB-34) TaxID=709986 RepID=E8U9Q1_DEIML|nr:hypothetical protein [Deinococcus maricopensis]ADV67790.1 hypothetical protein Deima_2150 [Deinococcus maricopensis DSM 21211]
MLRPLLSVLAPLLLASTLGACTRTGDDFKPRIVITEPDGGAVARAAQFVVRGYVMDNNPVASIRVGTTALPVDGHRIVPFQFRALVNTDRATYTITAADGAGNTTKLELPVRVDAARPTLTITKFERDGRTLRVTGRARDNIKVAFVSVDGNRLNITPGREVEFYAETTGIWADVEVRDAAGNVTKQRVR